MFDPLVPLHCLQRLTPITNQDKLQAYALDTLEGLKYIHSQGIIHADLKLQNLLLDRPSAEEKAQGELPQVKICDFGLSHIREPAKSGKAMMVTRCGTQGYIAPEVGPKNSLIGTEIDMFAVGVMLYELMAAYKPTKLQNYRYGKSIILTAQSTTQAGQFLSTNPNKSDHNCLKNVKGPGRFHSETVIGKSKARWRWT